jgi:hypothetical protein
MNKVGLLMFRKVFKTFWGSFSFQFLCVSDCPLVILSVAIMSLSIRSTSEFRNGF